MTPTTSTRLGGMQIFILLLTAATALIHLWLGISAGLIMFIANGLGYLALAAAAYLPIAPLANVRVLAKWALLGYTAITIIGWVLIGERNAIGFIDKAIEVVLIILIFLDLRQKPE
jgi:hypothetical protein